MSTELERQLRAGFGRLPKPSREASARARAAALAALGPSDRRSRGGILLVAFAVAFVVGAGAAALAATGNLHVRLGARAPSTRPVPTRLSVPSGSRGVAVVAGGKLWLATRGGHARLGRGALAPCALRGGWHRLLAAHPRPREAPSVGAPDRWAGDQRGVVAGRAEDRLRRRAPGRRRAPPDRG